MPRPAYFFVRRYTQIYADKRRRYFQVRESSRLVTVVRLAYWFIPSADICVHLRTIILVFFFEDLALDANLYLENVKHLMMNDRRKFDRILLCVRLKPNLRFLFR